MNRVGRILLGPSRALNFVLTHLGGPSGASFAALAMIDAGLYILGLGTNRDVTRHDQDGDHIDDVGPSEGTTEIELQHLFTTVPYLLIVTGFYLLIGANATLRAVVDKKEGDDRIKELIAKRTANFDLARDDMFYDPPTLRDKLGMAVTDYACPPVRTCGTSTLQAFNFISKHLNGVILNVGGAFGWYAVFDAIDKVVAATVDLAGGDESYHLLENPFYLITALGVTLGGATSLAAVVYAEKLVNEYRNPEITDGYRSRSGSGTGTSSEDGSSGCSCNPKVMLAALGKFMCATNTFNLDVVGSFGAAWAATSFADRLVFMVASLFMDEPLALIDQSWFTYPAVGLALALTVNAMLIFSAKQCCGLGAGGDEENGVLTSTDQQVGSPQHLRRKETDNLIPSPHSGPIYNGL